ncbi:MAG: SDR family NAD(P)-dependent oxidoreductase, partial [Actinomycetota bacterium]|nr:SDR family NAD(P)-dependent oxidoreductase [Actinomycetota bacterium]
MSNRLEGKVCIVTGAGRGIGRAVALAFAEEGASVVVNDADRAAADEVVEELGGSVAVAHGEPIGTVGAADSVLATALDRFGRLDVLVNNAGILRDRMTHKMSEEDFDQVIQVHLKGTWACGRAAIQHWRPLAKA